MMDDVNDNNGVTHKTSIYYTNDDDGHGKCSCWSKNNFFVVLICISIFLNGYLCHVHNMLPSDMTRSVNNLYPTRTTTTRSSSINASTTAPTLPPTKNTTPLLSLAALTSENVSSDLVTTALATTMDTTNNDCNVTTSSSSSSIGIANSGMAYHFEATTAYRQSNTLPQWMKDYFDWHREQTIKLDECNYRDYRFMILRCSLAERKCGGVADRLKSLPFFIAAAASSKRIFLIRWERPTKLEEFLLPNEINWSVPDWMYGKFNSFKDSPDAYYITAAHKIASGIKKYKDVLIIEGLMQDFYGGSNYYYKWDCEMDGNKQFNETYYKQYNDMAGWHSYDVIFRDLFFSLFEPSLPVAKLVQEKMKSADLVSDRFSTSQYRAFYGIENKKQSKEESELITKTTNALNCASKIQPGDPIFFASDSNIAVLSARKMAEDNNNRQIVTFSNEQEALHLDKKDQWKSGNIADFFPTFVDLLIMAEAKCMALGVGGFGRFANMISRDPTCVIRHDSERKGKIEYCKWYDNGDDHMSKKSNNSQ